MRVREIADIKFAEPKATTITWRLNTFFTKEPQTLAWIDGFGRDDVFFDVGANVGLYSLYAAKRGCQVYAFEPIAANYHYLQKNIGLNGWFERCVAYCCALSDADGIDMLYLDSGAPGKSMASYAEQVSERLTPKISRERQGCVAFTLDSFVAKAAIPRPTHIKIDVDGLEHKVVAGAAAVIAAAKSVLIELNPAIPQHAGLIEMMHRHGFVTRSKPVKNVENQLFVRDGSL